MGSGVCRKIRPETAEGGRQTRRRTNVGAGEAEGNYGGARADLRRDVWILERDRKWIFTRGSNTGSRIMRAVTLSVSVVLLYLSMFVSEGSQGMRIDMLRISKGGGVTYCYVSCLCET